MSFSFSSIGHALATGLHDFYKGIVAVESFITKVDTPANQALVESLTNLVPVVGPQAVQVERGVFAVAGELASILTNVSSNGEAALVNAGFDATVIADFKALIQSVPGLFTIVPTPVTPATK